MTQRPDAIAIKRRVSGIETQNASKNWAFAKQQKRLRLRWLDGVIHNALNATEVTRMPLTANALAKKLGCAWVTVRRAITKGELKAVWDSDRRAWLVEDGRELTLFRARLDYLRSVRQQRRERMKVLWRTGKLRPRRRKRVVVQVQVQRPTVVAIGQGIYERTAPIRWHGDEGSFCCPSCAAPLKVR